MWEVKIWEPMVRIKTSFSCFPRAWKYKKRARPTHRRYIQQYKYSSLSLSLSRHSLSSFSFAFSLGFRLSLSSNLSTFSSPCSVRPFVFRMCRHPSPPSLWYSSPLSFSLCIYRCMCIPDLLFSIKNRNLWFFSF